MEYGDAIIPLNSVGANRIAEKLILPSIYPPESLKAEFRIGKSRFDFLADAGSPPGLIEVKACTLCEEGVAMFPDAPSLRAVKHLEELASLAEEGEYRSRILFVISNPNAERFVPGIHTDPAFATALKRAAAGVDLQAAVVACDQAGIVRLVKESIPIDLAPAEAAAADSGAYILRIYIESVSTIKVGALGTIRFEPGAYIYIGSAMQNLTRRVARHLRRRKRFRWHIDYLRDAAHQVEAFPIRSLKRLECSLAREVAALADEAVAGFGSSDCGCLSHLFRIDPEDSRLERLILRYRHQEALKPYEGIT